MVLCFRPSPKKDNFLPTPWRCHLLRTWISVPFQKIRKTIFPSEKKIQRKGFQIQLRTKLWFKVDSIIHPFNMLVVKKPHKKDKILIIVYFLKFRNIEFIGKNLEKTLKIFKIISLNFIFSIKQSKIIFNITRISFALFFFESLSLKLWWKGNGCQ